MHKIKIFGPVCIPKHPFYHQRSSLLHCSISSLSLCILRQFKFEVAHRNFLETTRTLTRRKVTQLREVHFRSWKPNFAVNFLELSTNETMVSKRYFEQRSLAGLQMKAQAYSFKIGLTAAWKPRGFSIFKNMPPFFVYVAMDLFVMPSLSCASSRYAPSFFSSVVCYVILA